MTLKELRIQNIVLIESATIPFSEGFNVVSGETGSGKSALMDTLSLIAGERADATLIRHGADKGVVTALFDIEDSVQQLLDKAGIEHAKGEPLIIRREIAANGKGRAFVNNQPTQLSLLKQLSALLFDQVGQHANQKLLTTEEHRAILDLFAELSSEVTAFTTSWEAENSCRNRLEQLQNSATERARKIDTIRYEIEELEEAALKEGEEEELFAAYTRLLHADELATHLNGLNELLHTILPQMSRQRVALEKARAIDPTFNETADSFQNVILELQEMAYTFEKGVGSCESQPERTAEINERLGVINKLKRKYGTTIAEMQTYLQQAKNRLEELERADEMIEALQKELETYLAKNESLAKALTKKRQTAAKNLAKALTPEIQSLNMPKALFELDVTPQPRSSTGDDRVEFFLKPNLGEKRLPIKDFASGGELSRLMLALQTLLAGKQQLPTLVFDEIDANIGGTTASVIGEKLRQIGKSHQLIAITHFPQVAKHADSHLQIVKREREGRTFTEIMPLLEKKLREQELARMSGLSG